MDFCVFSFDFVSLRSIVLKYIAWQDCFVGITKTKAKISHTHTLLRYPKRRMPALKLYSCPIHSHISKNGLDNLFVTKKRSGNIDQGYQTMCILITVIYRQQAQILLHIASQCRISCSLKPVKPKGIYPVCHFS